MQVVVTYEKTQFNLNLYITSVNRQPLCGREWIRKFIKEKGASSLFSVLQLESELPQLNFNKTEYLKNLLDKFPSH